MIDARKYNNSYDLGKDIFLKDKYDPEIDALLKTETVYERLEYRCKANKNSKVPALVSKPNLFCSPFKPVPHPDYPSPWLSVSYDDFFKLVKACAYVIKRRFDLPPQSRIGVISNGLPINILITYALWYSRCTVVCIPPKLGNDVKQFWARMLDIKMIFFESNSISFFEEEKQKELNKSDKWIWDWQYPLQEDEYDLSAGYKGIPMFCMNNEEFCEEIYQCSLEGKSYTCPGLETDLVLIVGTSSSSQAIIKNGHCSKMKFIPVRCIRLSLFQHFLINDKDLSPRLLLTCPIYHMMGIQWGSSHIMNTGGPLIFPTQTLQNIGFVPENFLDDIIDVKPGTIPLFPFHYTDIKKLFDEKHPKCEIWKKAISACSKVCFRSGGAPISHSIIRWFEDTFNVPLNNECGSSETGLMMYKREDEHPGEETALTRCPWNYFYLKPIEEGNEDEGELLIYSYFIISGYIGRAKKGEFYESPIPGIRLDYEHEKMTEVIDGIEYFKTNDIWHRNKETDDTQYEVVCFVEPNWSKIVMEDGKPFDISVDPESLSKQEIVHLRKIAQKQTWNSIYNLLMGSSKSLNTWAKQLTINNIFIIDYGRKFPVTAKGSLSRRVAKLEYSYVLKNISKLINGEIQDLEEEEEEEKENKEKEEVINKEESEKIEPSTETSNEPSTEPSTETNGIKKENTPVSEIKTQEEIDEEIQNAIKIIYESIKEIVPSTPKFEEFNIKAPFTMYSIDSLGEGSLFYSKIIE
ncbi:hypothetical protein PIROE2DRAFT_62972 [Piromyces sp. E2]|nr:hypothetical protein PIROE2DRAFT_62972 [Piromyces sp. E2]|eukprot:OUM60724.1 hypothetical protein PIROE2DRAFT_62972 [Piromyces sp. E2]